jgi:hypothetical protein
MLEGGALCVIRPVANWRTYFSPIACQNFGEEDTFTFSFDAASMRLTIGG